MSEAILSIPQFNSSTDNLPLTTIHDSISAKGINAGSSKTISLGKTILFAVISHGESGTANGRVKGVGIDGSNVLIGYTWASSSNPSFGIYMLKLAVIQLFYHVRQILAVADHIGVQLNIAQL